MRTIGCSIAAVALLALVAPRPAAAQDMFTVYDLVKPQYVKTLKIDAKTAVRFAALRDEVEAASDARIREEKQRTGLDFGQVDMDDVIRASTRKAVKLLTRDQRRRLNALVVRREGVRVVFRPEGAAALRVDPETIEAIREVLEAEHKEAGARVEQLSAATSERGPVKRTEAERKREQKQIEADFQNSKQTAQKEALRLLTKRQREKLRAWAESAGPDPEATPPGGAAAPAAAAVKP